MRENGITLNIKDFEIRYYPSADKDKYQLIGQAKDFTEAITMINRFVIKKLKGHLKYGITFVTNKKDGVDKENFKRL